MALHADVQKKAQLEIDTVIGTDRLPEFKDRPSLESFSLLPFVNALCQDTMRWRPVLPIGVHHATTTDDVYNGYFIPKGNYSAEFPFIHVDSIYPDPECFNPDRFLTEDGKLNDDASVLAFGFGRRLCPGRHNADDTIWATIVSVLSTFDIAKAKDAAGNEIDINPGYSDNFFRWEILWLIARDTNVHWAP
ncbi:cytochrome P450 [Mycena sanguinolenta]|nr:cytochrome P450 [Mycena sanguinolenta]